MNRPSSRPKTQNQSLVSTSNSGMPKQIKPPSAMAMVFFDPR